METKERIRRDRATLLESLRSAGADVQNPSKIRCPFHDDKHASAGVYSDEHGVWRFKCHANCCEANFDVFDVRQRTTGEAVESQLSALARQDRDAQPKARSFSSIEAWKAAYAGQATVYAYTDPDTKKVDLYKLRIDTSEGKTFRQGHEVDGRIVEKAPPKPHPIYNRTRIRVSDSVVVVEGEKCVHALAGVNVVATTGPGGGGKGRASECDWRPLAGKTVILWPDHDPVGKNGERGGHEHMREVAEQLRQLSPPPSVWWLDPAKIGMGDKEDAADYIERFDVGGRADAVSDALDMAQPMGGSSELEDHFNEIISGKFKLVEFPFKRLTKATRALLPGTITVIVGDPGSTKSMFVVECLWKWGRKKIPASAYMLEDDRKFHLMRVLAQIDKNANLSRSEWIEEYPVEAMAAMNRHREEVDAVGARIFEPPGESVPTYDDILEWIERRLGAGDRVVIVDPVTAVDAGKNIWDEDKKFMARAKALLRRYRASLVLVSHPRSSNNKGHTDDAAGSRAFGRFAQCMLWLKSSGSRPWNALVKSEYGDVKVEANRVIKIPKARNGWGQGHAVAFSFQSSSLTFEEHGMVVALKAKEDGGDE